MAEKAGLEFYLYRMTGGSFASPTWTDGLMDQVQDMSLNLSRTAIAAPTRASRYRKSLVGLIGWPLQFTLLRDDADTNQIALEAAFLAAGGTDVTLALADGPIATNGTKYTKATYKITGWQKNEPLDGPATIAVTAELSATSDDDPTPITVGS